MKIITVTANPALDITAHVDNWQRGVVNRGQAAGVAAGGKGINVAVNLAHSGMEVYATGWLGQDNDAVFRRSFMKDRVNDAFIRIDGETRRNVKIVDSSAEAAENTNFNMPGVKIGNTDQQQLKDYLESQVDEWTVLMFGGSLPQGVSVDFYAEMVQKFRGKSHFLVVDTDGVALSEVLQADWLPDMIKPNVTELRQATGKALETDDEIVAEAIAWVNRGIKLMVVSLGDGGAWFVTKEQAVKAVPPQVNVVSTVGAGDAMVSGVIHDVVTGADLTEIATTATAFSVANVETDSIGLPSLARLEVLKSQVTVQVRNHGKTDE